MGVRLLRVPLMHIESGETYDHAIHGEVKVGSVLDSYSTYDTDDGVGHGATTIVRFSSRWDEYGILEPPVHEKADEFVKHVK